MKRYSIRRGHIFGVLHILGKCDDVDIKILRDLFSPGSKSLMAVSERLGIPKDEIIRRVTRMKRGAHISKPPGVSE